MYSQQQFRDSTLVLWLSVLHEEIHRSNPYDVNRVRSLFESAVESRRFVIMHTIFRVKLPHTHALAI